MAFIKKILAHPLIKMFVGSKLIKSILFVMICLLPIFLIYRWWKKRKAAQAAIPEEDRKLAPSDLVRAWKTFTRQIPSDFRRTIFYYQHFVVLGESGSGKSKLIDDYTDWQGQSFQFYPSYTSDPNLQIYLGSKELVQEIPASLLRDNSQEARKALHKLWDKIFHKAEPTVICTLKASFLTSAKPDSLRKQAQMIRGKINVISRIRKKPVKVQLVLTHMDQIDGFQEFSSFLEKNSIPLLVSLKENSNREDLEHCLHPYEKYLPLALTTLNSGDYTKILTFLSKSPEIFSSLFLFFQTLEEADPLSIPPKVHELMLTSSILGAQLSNPFSSELAEELRRPRDEAYLQTHRRFAAALVLFGFFYLFFGFWFEQRKIVQQKIETEKDLALYRQEPSKAVRERVKASIDDFFKLKEKHPILQFVPTYVVEVETIKKKYENKLGEIDQDFVQNMRDLKLLPLLNKLIAQKGAYDKPLYVLALLFATDPNDEGAGKEMGTLIQKHLSEWAKNLNISEKEIEKYLKNCDSPWKDVEKLNLAQAPFKGEDELSLANNLQAWLIYFLELEQAITKPFISTVSLEEFIEKARRFHHSISQVRRYQLAREIFNILLKTSPLNLKPVYEPYFTSLKGTEWMAENIQNLNNFLLFILQSRIDVPALKKRNLHNLAAHLRAVELDASEWLDQELDKVKLRKVFFDLKLAKKKFLFKATDWVRLLHRSKNRLLALEFFIRINELPGSQSRIFFTDSNSFSNLEMSPGKYGTAFFSGKAKIPGHYTFEAFRKEVKPVLETMELLFKRLPWTNEEKRMLENFIAQQIEEYATLYRRYTENFYQSFAIKAPSVVALKIILTQMQIPSSPFYDFLTIIRKNTSLDKSASKLLKPLYEKLKPFEPINKLLAEKSEKLKDYHKLLNGIKSDLEGGEKEKGAPQAKKDDKGAKGEKGEEAAPNLDPFVNSLTPLGALGYPVFKENDTSILALCKNWLESVEIYDKWQKPFLTPIIQLYDLGLQEIQDTAINSWENLILPKILPLLSKFPFNPKAEEGVTPVNLEEVLHPHSAFWLKFKQLVAPVCVKNKQKGWLSKIPFRGQIKYPKKMFEIINHLQMMSETLWDKTGKPIPIKIEVKPHPLPTNSFRGKKVILAYFSSYDSEAFSFNQRSSWKPFEILWWKEGTSKVGIQMGDMDTGSKFYQDVVIPEKLWSFYRLIQTSKMIKKNELTWYFPKESTSGEIRIRFSLKKDPWELFQIKGIK